MAGTITQFGAVRITEQTTAFKGEKTPSMETGTLVARVGKDQPVELSIIVPAHNEEENLPSLVDRLRATLRDGSIKGEIVIVDDGSTDKTWTVARDLSTQFGDFVVCVRQRRRAGKATALQTGFDASSGSVIAMIDADLQYAPEEIPKMLQVLNQGYDVVNGLRDFSQYPRSRRIISRVYNKMAHLFIGYDGHDLNCGLKVFRREVIESMRLRTGYHR